MSTQRDLRKSLSLWGGAGRACLWMLLVIIHFSLHPPPRGRVPYGPANILKERLSDAMALGFAFGSLSGYGLAVYLRRRSLPGERAIVSEEHVWPPPPIC